MFIIWGTKIKRDPRGIVADHCPVCMKVRRFAVVDHYEYRHFYFVTVGDWLRRESTRKCRRCRSEFACVPKDYSELLPAAAADEMTLDELVKRTNPPLAEIRAKRQQLEDMASEPTNPSTEAAATEFMAPGTPLREVPASMQEVELREALGRLKAYEGGTPEVTVLFHKLQGWRDLDSAGRSALLREVHTFIDEDQKTTRAIHFLEKIVRSYPRYSGLLPTALLLGVLGFGFLWVYGRQPWLVSAYFLFVLVAGIACYYFVSNATRRRWMRDTVIPQADEADVDLKTLTTVMEGFAEQTDRIDGGMGELVADAWLLKQEAVALGRWEAGELEKGEHPEKRHFEKE